MKFRIKAEYVEGFEKQFNSLRRVAKRVGAELPTWSVVREYDVETDRNGVKFAVPFVEIQVNGDILRMPGFSLLGVVSYLEDGRGIVGRFPDAVEIVADLTPYTDRPPVCEHCRTLRQRKETFLVREVSTGLIRQIGRDCLAEYTGHKGAEGVAAWLELMSTFEDEDEDEGGSPSGDGVSFDLRFHVRDTLAVGVDIVTQRGYISRAKAEESAYLQNPLTPTAESVKNFIYNRVNSGSSLDLSTETQAEADTILRWVRDEVAVKDSLSEYEHNLVMVCEQTYIDKKHVGILVSAVAAHRRELERRAKQASSPSEHVGVVGERRDFVLKLVRTATSEGMYGTTWILAFQDAAGNDFVWFSSNRFTAEIGETFTITATVKAHGERNGRKQTVLTRGTVKSAKAKAA